MSVVAGCPFLFIEALHSITKVVLLWIASPLMNSERVHRKMKYRSMWSHDRSWPIRLTDLNKCYDSCNYLKIKSPKNSTIHPIQVYDVVPNIKECANAGKSNLDGRCSGPLDGEQIARELNNTGWTIRLCVGIPSSNPVVSHTYKCMFVHGSPSPLAYINYLDTVYYILPSHFFD